MKVLGRRMSRIGSVLLVALVLAAVATAALAAPPDGKGKNKGKGGPSPSPSPTATEDPTLPGDGVNEADRAFVSMMIPHHHQALLMSALAPDATTDFEIVAFASRIDVEQTVEIQAMQNWQSQYGLPVTDPAASYAMMMQDPMMVEMMGMATQAELDQLAAATDLDFELLFLQLMIEHHEGAVRMAVDVLTNGSDPVLAVMAGDMLNGQSIQIDMMHAMLAERS